MQIKKIGATISVILRFTEADWEVISTADELLAEIETRGGSEYQFTITPNAAGRELHLQAQTAGWAAAQYRGDLKVVKDGIVTYYPDKTFIEFQLINPVSETANTVEG